MTRIVRFEEIDGDLVLRVPADLAARLKFLVGDEVAVSDGDKVLTIERIADADRRQLAIAMQVIDENDEALATLAK